MTIIYTHNPGESAQAVNDENPFPTKVSGPVTVGRGAFRSAAGFTRPANTTAYTAKDAVSDSTSAPTPLRFADVLGPTGNAGYITRVTMFTSQTTDTSRYRLHLFSEKPAATNDNSAYPGPLLAQWENFVGSLDLGPMKTEGSGSTAAYAEDKSTVLKFVVPGGGRDLWGLLEVLDAPTPASGQEYRIRLAGDRD